MIGVHPRNSYLSLWGEENRHISYLMVCTKLDAQMHLSERQNKVNLWNLLKRKQTTGGLKYLFFEQTISEIQVVAV